MEKIKLLSSNQFNNDSEASGSPETICSYLECNEEYDGSVKVEKLFENTKEIF
jgi:hypothetical protein